MSARWSRRHFVNVGLAAAGGWLVASRGRVAFASQGGAADDIRARVSSVIAEYDSHGIHRTATDVDRRSADWLLDRARQTGADAALEPFELRRVDIHGSFVEASGRRIESLPLFDATFTSESGVTGQMGTPGSASPIALVEVDGAGISSEGRSLAQLRRSSSHRAIVIVTRGAQPGLTPMNAASFSDPFGVPAVQVSSEDAAWLQELAREGREVRLVAHAERVQMTAQNVVATVRGRQTALPPVVVMTPRSGWWQCASERGGGLACWLEAMRAAARGGLARTTIFVASSGHELGHLGLESFLSRREDLIKGAAAWIHLGANIGAAGGRPRLQASDDAIEAMAAEALKVAGRPVEQRVARGTVPAGEARNIHEGGGRYVSLLGTGPYFHSPTDRWPASVDAAAVAQFSAGIADLVARLAS